jgi:hypothetical protein
VQLDASFVIHGIFHNTQKAFVRAFANDYGLPDQLVTAKGARGSHRGTTSSAISSVQGRVYTAEIWTLGLGAATLRGHGDDIRASNHEYTLVLDQFAVSDEECTAMDVEDFSLTAFATKLFHVVFVPNLGAVAICCYGVLIPAGHLRYLSVQECSKIALLIDNTQDFTVDTNDAANG